MTRIWQVDAFTDVPFAGNPAGVCLLESPPDEVWMQSVAAEMNLAETAYVWPEDGSFRLRWFTPTTEVDLCGHATLASAHILWESGKLAPNEQAEFETRSGRLTADRQDGWIVLNFPSEPATSAADSVAVSAAIGAEIVSAWWNRFDILAEVNSAATVRNLVPDLRAIHSLNCRGMIVTAPPDDDRYDFVSRFFAPGAGIDEDPVTGSAHCFLGPYWSERLNKMSMTGYQASKRGGVVGVEMHGNRVTLHGQAVTVLEATLLD